jgi:2-polyprenyl-6-methoxyphenol hydroxylase-like FAD-dependent oxidoreductase
VLAQELARHRDHAETFAAYQRFMKPAVDKRQKSARQFAALFVPTRESRAWLRRIMIRAFFAQPFLSLGMRLFGARSILGRAD